jgi:glycine cleavage system H lipoate-binding protein
MPWRTIASEHIARWKGAEIMVAILVFLTFVTFVAAALVVSRRREPAMEDIFEGEALRAPPLSAALATPTSSYLHPGHVWVRLAPDGLATVGPSAFASNFVGALSRVEVPEKGMELRQGEPVWTLVSGKNRRLTQAMPLDGTVVEVNRDVADRRGGAVSKKADWILKIRPARLAENVQNLIRESLTDVWEEASALRMNAVLAPVGRVANDGGVWVENFGDMLSDADWLEIRQEVFPQQQGMIVH